MTIAKLAKLAHIEKCMQKQWYDLVMAGQRGTAIPELERMYASYMQVLEEYLRCYEEQHQRANAINTNQCA
ncbi:MAG: hypothetical protein ABI456_07025 [Ktedonobacteraceae bacterium]|nr:hypothetical protein [Chloroflexota bacterium]